MKHFLISISILLSGHLFAQDSLLILYGSAGLEYGKASAMDSKNNYINGSLFQNTIDIDGAGTTLTAPGVSTQMAITKYNEDGELLWGFEAGGTATSESPHGIDVDKDDNIYVCGYFGNPAVAGSFDADFDPNGGGTISTVGNEDIFLAKYDSMGMYQWAFSMGNLRGETQERAWDLATDSEGNSYMVGGFHGVMDFNPLGTPVLDSIQDTTAAIFIAKYNTQGLHEWHIIVDAKGESVFFETYATCDLDENNNLYVSGNFRGTQVEFNPFGTSQLLSSLGQNDIFLARYNGTSGVLDWVNQIGSPSQDLVAPGALRCDNLGRPYITGRLAGNNTVDFNVGGSPILISNSSLFLTSFDVDGNHLNTVGMQSGPGDGGHRVGFDANNDVFLAGWFNGTAIFGSQTLIANSNTADNFLAKYSSDLSTCYWGLNFGGTNSQANNIVAGLSVDNQGNPIITGQLFGQNANLTPLDSFQTIYSSTGNNDCFIVKYDTDGKLWRYTDTQVGTNEIRPASNFSVYPNPFSAHIRVNSSRELVKASITSMHGVVTYLTPAAVIDVSFLKAGVYVLELQFEGDSTTYYQSLIK